MSHHDSHGKDANKSCLFCKESKRKCDGIQPTCSNCTQYRQVCNYNYILKAIANSSNSTSSNSNNANSSLNNDRRRRKYHTDYIESLEVEAARLEDFIKKFEKDEPEGSRRLDSRLNDLNPKQNEHLLREDHDYFEDSDNLADLLKETQKLSLEGPDNIYSNPFITELQETVLETANITGLSSTSYPISLNGPSLYIRDPQYQSYVINLFKYHFAVHSPSLMNLASFIESLDYNTLEEPVTLKLLLNVVLGMGNIYSNSENKAFHEQYFISLAKDSFMGIICTSPVDVYLLTSIHLLSCYELAQNHSSQSALYNSIACSLTQHMGLHISYGTDENSLAPSQTPFNLAMLWSICLQDRLISNSLEIPCVIHFKRIISPFYKVVSDPSSSFHLPELCFSYVTRLWYIFDRFTDQIYTISFDIGDTNNRLKLLSMGLKTLEELISSLPSNLALKALDGSSNDLFVLILHFNYQMSILQLNKIFIRDKDTSIIRKAFVKSVFDAVDLLKKLNRDEFLDYLPYYFPGFIYSIGVVLIFILGVLDSTNAEYAKIQASLDLTKELSSKLSIRWKSAGQNLNNLIKLSLKNGISVVSTDTASPWGSSASSLDEFGHMDRLFQHWEEQFPQFNELKVQFSPSNSSSGNAPSNGGPTPESSSSHSSSNYQSLDNPDPRVHANDHILHQQPHLYHTPLQQSQHPYYQQPPPVPSQFQYPLNSQEALPFQQPYLQQTYPLADFPPGATYPLGSPLNDI